MAKNKVNTTNEEDKKKKKKLFIIFGSILGAGAIAGASAGIYFAVQPKTPQYNVSCEVNGVTLSKTKATKGKEFNAEIGINEQMVGEGYTLPTTLTKVVSGDYEVKTTEYTYDLKDDNKKADFKIPGEYVKSDITIDLNLVDPGPNWQTIDKEQALAQIVNIRTNLTLPSTTYTAYDNVTGKAAIQFDNEQKFFGIEVTEGEGYEYLLNRQIVYTVLDDAKTKFWNLYANFEGEQDKNEVGPNNDETWSNCREDIINEGDYGAKLIMDDDFFETFIEDVDSGEGSYWFKSYDDSSLQYEIKYHYTRGDEDMWQTIRMTIENNFPKSVEYFSDNDVFNISLSYKFNTSVTIPEEANPDTWGGGE